MYGMNYSGGANRTHGQIERAERIDSFEAGKVEGWGTLFSNSMVPLDCGHFMKDDWEIIELSKRPMVYHPGTDPYAVRLWRELRLLAMSPLWKTCQIFVLQEPGLPVPGVCQAELSLSAADEGQHQLRPRWPKAGAGAAGVGAAV